MSINPEYFRNPQNHPSSPLAGLDDVVYSDKERSIAEELVAADRDRDEHILEPVDPRCITSVMRAPRRGRTPDELGDREAEREMTRREHPEYVRAHDDDVLRSPEMEACPLIDSSAMGDLEDEIASPSRRNDPDFELRGPFLKGTGMVPCAWYRPHHVHGPGFGIVVRIPCVHGLARSYAALIDNALLARNHPRRVAHELVIIATKTLVMREYYRHKIESFGFRLRAVETQRDPDAYLCYLAGLRQAIPRHDANQLEDALAVAFAIQRLRGVSERRNPLHSELSDAASDALVAILEHPNCLPSYKGGVAFVSRQAHRVAEWELMQRVLENRAPTTLCGTRWATTSGMMGGLGRPAKIPLMLVR